MKKILLSVVITLISYSMFAQNKEFKTMKDIDPPATYGIRGGVTFANLAFDGATSNPGVYLGGTVSIPVDGAFSLQSGLTLIAKGGKITINNVSQKMSPWYLEIPINGIISFEKGPGKFFVGGGPYLSFGLFGNIEEQTVGSNQITTSSIKYGRDVSTFDFGLNFLLGYQFNNGFSLSTGYSLGLTNMNPNLASCENRVFSVGLGFAFF